VAGPDFFQLRALRGKLRPKTMETVKPPSACGASERNQSDGHRVDVESADRMTGLQIVQKVREHFNATMGRSAPTWDTTPPEDMICEG
jgi:hypothetical protein